MSLSKVSITKIIETQTVSFKGFVKFHNQYGWKFKKDDVVISISKKKIPLSLKAYYLKFISSDDIKSKL